VTPRNPNLISVLDDEPLTMDYDIKKPTEI